MGLLWAALLITVLCVVYLFDRMKRLELGWHKETTDLVNIVNHLYASILRPRPIELESIKAQDAGGAVELIDHYIGHRLFHQVPALRRVITFSIGLSLGYLNAKTRITVDDLRGLEPQFSGQEGSPTGFFPAALVAIEQWATHIVIVDYAGRRTVFYDDDLFCSFNPKVLWTHTISPGEAELYSGSLEVVLYQGCIKCWAVDGRFSRRIPPHRVPRDEYVLVSVPIEDKALEPYRSAMDRLSDDPEIRFFQHHWIRHYEHEWPDESFRWNLEINDIVARLTGAEA